MGLRNLLVDKEEVVEGIKKKNVEAEVWTEDLDLYDRRGKKAMALEPPTTYNHPCMTEEGRMVVVTVI